MSLNGDGVAARQTAGHTIDSCAYIPQVNVISPLITAESATSVITVNRMA